MRQSLWFLGLAATVAAQCPYMDRVDRRSLDTSEDLLESYTVDDTNVYMTSDVGGPMSDQESLVAGERGPTLLEDFIFRQKITHFDHERVSIRPSTWMEQSY